VNQINPGERTLQAKLDALPKSPRRRSKGFVDRWNLTVRRPTGRSLSTLPFSTVLDGVGRQTVR
jgi:hypothetical protein